MSHKTVTVNVETNLIETNFGFFSGPIEEHGVADAEGMLTLLESDGQDPRSETALPFSFFVSSRSESEAGVLSPGDLQNLSVVVEDKTVAIRDHQILYVVLGEKDEIWELAESPICTEIGEIPDHLGDSDAANHLMDMFTSDLDSLTSFYERVEATRQVDARTIVWVWSTYWKGCHRSAQVEISSETEIGNLRFVFGFTPPLVPAYDEMFEDEEDDESCIDIGYFGGVYLKAVVNGNEIIATFDQDEDRSSSHGQYMIDYRADEYAIPQVVLFQSEP